MKHNDGWAIANIPKFFRRALEAWAELNKNKPFIDGNVENETEVQVWMSLREYHYAHWKLQSGKLLRRPESKLTNVKVEHDKKNVVTFRTLGLKLVDRKTFDRENWEHYGTGRRVS